MFVDELQDVASQFGHIGWGDKILEPRGGSQGIGEAVGEARMFSKVQAEDLPNAAAGGNMARNEGHRFGQVPKGTDAVHGLLVGLTAESVGPL